MKLLSCVQHQKLHWPLWVSSIVLVVDVTLKKTTFPMSLRGGRSRAQWCSPGTSGRSAASGGPWRGPPWRRWGIACTIQSPCCLGQAPPIGCEPCPWNTYGPSGRSSPKQSAVRRQDSEAYRQLDIQTYVHLDIQTYKQLDIQTYVQLDIQTYKQLDIQT